MSFVEQKGCWLVVFWNKDRMRTPLSRKARFNADETMIEFIRRAGGCKTIEEKIILEMMMKRKSGEVSLELTDEQYEKLRR